MSNLILTAGVARIDITPPVGFRMQGAMRRIEGSTGIESPLLATALVLADEQTKVVILDCDLIGLDLALAGEIRQAIGERVGTLSSHVMVGCTHTHNGPCTSRYNLGGTHDVAAEPGQIEALDTYLENLVRQLAGIASVADGQRRPVRVAAGCSEANVAVNREEINHDGRVLVGRNPDGVTDHSVDVLRVDDLEGNAVAVIVAYAAHPVVMGYHTYLLSPDYPGVVRRIVEQATNATCLFLTGAAGNQAARSFLQDDWGEKERMGGQIGAAALKAFYEIESRPYKEVRELGKSLSNIALYHKEFHAGPTHHIFKVAAGTAKVLLQPLPGMAELEAQLADAEVTLARLEAEGASTVLTVPQQIVIRWTRGVLEKVKSGITQETLSYPLVGYRIDDFVLLGMPGELFVEIQIRTKQRSKAKHTMFAGYANGILGYIPTAETVHQGGMSVSSAVRTYNISAPPVASSVDDVVAALGELLGELGL